MKMTVEDVYHWLLQCSAWDYLLQPFLGLVALHG